MLAPAETHLHDALVRRDPTRTYKLRARMRAEGDRRWQLLARTLRQALIEHDLVGLRGMSKLPYGDKTEGFGLWLAEELRQKVLGFDGGWLRPYIQEAANLAQRHATEMTTPFAAVDPDRVAAMQSLAISELRGIVAAAQQQIVRAVAHCLASSATPHRCLAGAAGIVKTMRNRTRAMADYIVVKTHATATLSALRSAGVTHVGTVAERLQPRTRQTAHGRVLLDKRRSIEEGEDVDVVTAGDDVVCTVCEEISDGGPYELDEAEGLIPAHPWCRCAFVPLSDARFANVREFDAWWFDRDVSEQPRAASAPGHSSGEFASWGGASHGAEVSPEQAAKVKELAGRTPGLKNLLPYLAPDEVNRLNNATVKKMVEMFSTFPVKPEEMAAVAFSGAAKRGWYEKSAKAIVDVFGAADAPRFAALLAALSPQTGVEDNLINGLNTWANWTRAGRPTDRDQIKDVLAKSVQGEKGVESILPAWVNNSVTALSAEDPAHIVLSGPKVDSFAENLRGHVNAVTLDSWMANYINVKQAVFARRDPVPGVSPGKGPMYIATSAVVRKASEILTQSTGYKWTPAEVQETIWSWAKTLYERATSDKATVQQLLKAGSVTHDDIADTPDFAQLFTTNVYNKILEAGGYAEQARALAASGGESGLGHERGGSLLAAEGSGIPQDAFERHLFRAAKRLDKVRAQRKAEDGLIDTAASEAAGVLFRTKTHMLLMKRRDTGEWSIPAGNLEKNETPLHGAQREAAEETGYPGDHRAYRAHTGVTRGVKFHTFVQPSEWQFSPILNPEHTQHAWVRPNKLPAPLHPGLVATLYAMSEGGGAVPLTRDYNEAHQPAGSPGGIGGQFAPAGTEGGGALSEGVKKTKVKPEDFEKDKVALGSFVDNPSVAKKFFEEWDTRIGEAPAKFKDQFLGRMDGMKVKTKDGSEHTLHTSMKIDYGNDNSIRITGNIYNESDMRIGTYERLIDLDNLKADSSYFKLNHDYTGGNAGKRMLAGNVEVYSKLGIPKLNVHANIDVGGYSWAKYGYVPTQSSWTSLRNSIKSRLSSDSRTRSGGGSGEVPGSWDEMSEDQHSDIERAWMRSTQNEFYESEVESWRDSGQALEDAKSSMAADYSPSDEWAMDAVAEWRETHEENNPKVPFTDDQILKSISFGYRSRYGDGRGDPSVDFDDEILNKSVDLSQPLLPGIEPISSKSLTQNARDEIAEHLTKAFNDEAEHKAGNVDPPSYLSDNISEFQGEYWDNMGERDRYRWARDNGELPEIEIESEEDEEPIRASDEQVDALLKLASHSNPKAIWAISDSAKGKDLLLGSDWYGSLNLKDKESMDRFKAYVGKAYK